VLLHGKTGWRLRLGAVALVVAILGWAGLASVAGADDARRYEQVSPADKGQGDIIGDGETTIAATLGDRVSFSTRTPFGDEIGSGVSGQTQYVARRTSNGWVSHAVTPTPRPDAIQTLFTATKLETFSDDLSSAIVWGYDLPGGGGTPNRNNIYEENTATRALRPLTLSQVDPLVPFDFLNMINWGVSADAQHVAFVTSTQLLPDAAPGVPNVYQWDSGTGLSLAGVLPGGSVPTGGSDVQPNDYRGAMSADGRRLVFTAAPNGVPELYMRNEGSVTSAISQPVGSQTDSTNVALQAMTPDGRNVFFVTDSPLDVRDNNGGPDLYRWTDSGDAAHDGVIAQISNSGDFGLDGTRNGVIGVSNDGSRVYYQTLGSRLVAWNNGVSSMISADVAIDASASNSLSEAASQPGLGRVTPDGMWLAFVTSATLATDGIHGLKGDITNGHYEMYVYSLRDGGLTCISCPSGAATSDALVVPDVTSGTPQLFDDAIRPHFLSDKGQVFFSTREALVPGDVNGVEDVYEYDAPTGALRLVSTGAGKDPTSFADAGANGDDVFVETRQQLDAGDRDGLVDLYDATPRSRMPFLSAPPSPSKDCQGDTCQPPSSMKPPDASFGSLSLAGGGTIPPAVRLLTFPSTAIGQGAVNSVRVRLSAAGRLTWRGRGVQTGSVKHGRGVFAIRVRLDRHARVQLNTRNRYVTRIRLTLVSADGTRVSGITRMTFRAAARKGR
jgi:hypothetical protein